MLCPGGAVNLKDSVTRAWTHFWTHTSLFVFSSNHQTSNILVSSRLIHVGARPMFNSSISSSDLKYLMHSGSFFSFVFLHSSTAICCLIYSLEGGEKRIFHLRFALFLEGGNLLILPPVGVKSFDVWTMFEHEEGAGTPRPAEEKNTRGLILTTGKLREMAWCILLHPDIKQMFSFAPRKFSCL